MCDLSRVLLWTNVAIATLAADPELPPTRFIIVGDHAPPFISEQSARSIRKIMFHTLN